VAVAGRPAERRRAPRVRVQLPVQVSEYGSVDWLTTSVDLSPSGMKVRPLWAAPASAVRLSVTLPADGERLEDLENLSKTIERDGLRQEVEGPEPQAFLCVPLGRDSRDHHDRDAGVAHRTELEEVEAAHAREPEIEQDQIRALDPKSRQRGFRRRREVRRVAELAGEVHQEPADIRVVFHDQDPHGALRLPAAISGVMLSLG